MKNLTLVACCAFLMLLWGCAKEDVDPSQYNAQAPTTDQDYELAEHTFEIDDVSRDMLVACDEEKLIYEGFSSLLDSLQVGDVIVSGAGPEAPYGYLRKIESLNRSGSRLELITKDATLEEAFDRLEIDFSDASPLQMGDLTGGNSRAACFTVQFNADSVKKYFNDSGIKPFNISLKACGSLKPRYIYQDIPDQPKVFEAGIDEAAMDFTFGLEIKNQLEFKPDEPIKLASKRLGAIFYGPVVIVPVIEVLLAPSLTISNGFNTTYNKGFSGQKYLRYDEPSESFMVEGAGLVSTGRGWEYSINLGTVTGQLKLTVRVAMKLYDSDNTKTFVDNSGSLIAEAKAEIKNGDLCIDASLQAQIDGALGGTFTPFGLNIFDNSFELYKFNWELAGFGTCRPENICINEVDIQLVDDIHQKGVIMSVERLGSNSSQYKLYANGDLLGSFNYMQSEQVDLSAYAGGEVALKVEDGVDPSCHYTRIINFQGGGSTNYPPPPPKMTITDTRDGETYCVVTIGGKKWFADNLRYSDGGSLGRCYNNASNCSADGRLYSWHEVDQEDLCPNGWHIPSKSEWLSLLEDIGQSYGLPIAERMKTSTGWASGGNGNNYSRFNVRPVGCYTGWNETFSKQGSYVGFWSATAEGVHSAFSYNFAYDNWPSNSGISVLERYDVKDYAHPCRCVED